MTNDIKVSVIVPIYNAEKWLNRCIESILQQTFDNIEIILINDGSTDSSKDICFYYVQKDSRVKLINQDNSGVSVARNMALNVASGDFIQFVDADDYIDKDMIAKLVENSSNADIIVTDYYKCLGGV